MLLQVKKGDALLHLLLGEQLILSVQIVENVQDNNMLPSRIPTAPEMSHAIGPTSESLATMSQQTTGKTAEMR